MLSSNNDFRYHIFFYYNLVKLLLDVHGEINMQVEKFLKNIKKHAGENRRVGGKFSGKSINVQGRNFLANQ